MLIMLIMLIIVIMHGCSIVISIGHTGQASVCCDRLHLEGNVYMSRLIPQENSPWHPRPSIHPPPPSPTFTLAPPFSLYHIQPASVHPCLHHSPPPHDKLSSSSECTTPPTSPPPPPSGSFTIVVTSPPPPPPPHHRPHHALAGEGDDVGRSLPPPPPGGERD